MNSLILFEKLGLISIEKGIVYFYAYEFNFADTSLGEAAADRISASGKLADIMLKGDASDFYLSLRVQI